MGRAQPLWCACLAACVHDCEASTGSLYVLDLVSATEGRCGERRSDGQLVTPAGSLQRFEYPPRYSHYSAPPHPDTRTLSYTQLPGGVRAPSAQNGQVFGGAIGVSSCKGWASHAGLPLWAPSGASRQFWGADRSGSQNRGMPRPVHPRCARPVSGTRGAHVCMCCVRAGVLRPVPKGAGFGPAGMAWRGVHGAKAAGSAWRRAVQGACGVRPQGRARSGAAGNARCRGSFLHSKRAVPGRAARTGHRFAAV
jgi:hypothetical protein